MTGLINAFDNDEVVEAICVVLETRPTLFYEEVISILPTRHKKRVLDSPSYLNNKMDMLSFKN